jgi:LAO/AO transport system kinase
LKAENPSPEPHSAESWAEALLAGERRALSRLISLAESHRPGDRQLVDQVLERTSPSGALRVALTGPPGVGKSSLLEAMGKVLIKQGSSLAALTIDPSSEISGGSLLADKTRMLTLSTSSHAFIRPMATGGGAGGIAPGTSRALALCDRAGFDILFLETVGVGQVEFDAMDLVDLFMMVVSPNLGDELQGMKRGITEHADIVVVNKSDLDEAQASRTREAYASSLRLFRSVEVPVIFASAHRGDGIEQVLTSLQEAYSLSGKKGEPSPSARERSFIRLSKQLLIDQLTCHYRARETFQDLISAVRAGTLSPIEGAQKACLRMTSGDLKTPS